MTTLSPRAHPGCGARGIRSPWAGRGTGESAHVSRLLRRAKEKRLDITHLPPAEAMGRLVAFNLRYTARHPEFVALPHQENMHRGHPRQGGVVLANGGQLMPDLIIMGRNRAKLEALASAQGIERVSTDPDAGLANPDHVLRVIKQRRATIA